MIPKHRSPKPALRAASGRRLPTFGQKPSTPTQISADVNGYTLQTIIVSAVLVLVAVAASIVLYSAISNNADVRAFADLTSENSPTRPSGFTAENYLDDTVPAVIIRWAPPLYTGQPVLAGSPSLLNYEATYNCETSDAIGLEQVTLSDTPSRSDFEIPEIDLGRPQLQLEISDFVTDPTIPTANCLLSVRAYTCPDVRPEARCGINDAKTGKEIYGPASLYRFVISKIPSALNIMESRIVSVGTDDRNLLISWETPIYFDTQNPENLIYRIEWNQRPRTTDPPNSFVADVNTSEVCTPNNLHILTVADDMVYDARITPQFITDPALEFKLVDSCPGSNQLSDAPGPAAELFTLDGKSFEVPPETPTGLAFELAESSPQSFDASPLVEGNVTEELISWNVTWSAGANNVPTDIDSYIFQWARADGIGQSESQEVSSPAITLTLLNGVSYDFSIRAQNTEGISEPLQACTTVATPHRHLKPDLVVNPRNNQLQIKIAQSGQEKYCQTETFCLDNSCQPPAPKHYKIRVYNTGDTCGTAMSFPNQLCTNSDIVVCADAPVGDDLVTERFLSNPSPDVEYAVEVIAGSECDPTARTINNVRDTNAPSFFASFSTATRATADPEDVFAPIEGLPPIAFDENMTEWSFEWRISGSPPEEPTGFLIRLERAATTTPPTTAEISFVLNNSRDMSALPWDQDSDSNTDPAIINCMSDTLQSRCTFIDNQNPAVETTLTVTITAIYDNGFSIPMGAMGQRSPTP